MISALKHHDVKPDLIFTTSPPESIHITGAKLTKKLHVPWVAEFRDTWVEMPHRHILVRSGFRRYVERRIAKHVLRHAQAVTSVSEAVMQEARKYVRAGTPEKIITHFSDKSSVAHPFDETKLNLVHTGGFTLSDRRRTVPPLLAALEEISQHRPELVLHIAGPLSDAEHTLIDESKTKIVRHGAVPLEKARALQKGADGLVLYTPPSSHALPGKYAEYCMAGRPILYIGGGDWLKLVDAPDILRPLVEGGIHLKKGEMHEGVAGLEYGEAGQELAQFLQDLL